MVQSSVPPPGIPWWALGNRSILYEEVKAMLGWLTLFVILGSGVCGGILFLLRRGPDPAIQARFDAWCR